MPRSIVYAPNTDKKINPADDPSQSRLVELGVNRQLRVDVGPPPASLAVWIIEPPTNSSTRGTVLVLHGVQDKKTSMLDIGRRLATAGYRAVLVDGRGHGRSSGQWLTYGVLESRDLSQLLDALATQDLLAGKVGVYGVSYGAAAGIMLAGRDARVAAAVAVAPVSSRRGGGRDYCWNDVLR